MKTAYVGLMQFLNSAFVIFL